MEVDASPSPASSARIPAALKGKGKAPPPPPTPQHPTTTSPVVASPIKISAVPKPFIYQLKAGQKGKPVTSYMPYKLAVDSKPSATNETRAGVTPRMPESGNRRHAMGKDASGSNTPSANAVTAAGRVRDASGSHAPQNPPMSGKNAPAKQQSTPAPTPHPYRPPSQAPSPPANPNATRLTVGDIEVLLNPKYQGQITLPTFGYDSQENRAIMDAVRNRGIAPAVAIANAEASALAKGNVKGPLGHPSEMGAAPPAVKTPLGPPPSSRVPTPPPPVPSRPPSPPRAPSPSALVLSSKRPISPGSSSPGPSVAAVSVRGSDDSSMALDYEDATTPRPASPADEEHLDSKESKEVILNAISTALGFFQAFATSEWKTTILDVFPTLMDDDLNAVYKYFQRKVPEFRSLLPPAVEAPASAVDAPAPHVIPRDAPPPADSAKSKPPKKKVRVDLAPLSDVNPPATAPLMEVDEPTVSSSASGKAPTKPLPIPSSKRASAPKDAPPWLFEPSIPAI
ncbi:hypothetical protein AGABI1DRAFT_133823 [Agaricus bisporus var. burnettii JB137-S8]|uniref:Uncharacterized protein n=1 Tax=Agaricus bisporus var. burnettii (strain JB137-S8 / ATCC MYA-4627 / FGSC 10392) TaxID=597362 RepID=K5WFA7_AGABU|nr:uncharacterized protein AGABI1DRAFT_133823 [Agaricus bisporus var. burnettii JB137-S8]EKM73956.1 hypothetical protein AGABI1DRAFT_133823 [Agaricus bisporus var. burnettii JB137-S8]